MIEQGDLRDEATTAGVPLPLLTMNTSDRPSWNTIGGAEGLLPAQDPRRQMHFAIGYSEPGAGTDLASLTTRAVHDGDDYVINGSKMWTSVIETRDTSGCRANRPDAARHKGLSMFLVPTTAAGFSSLPCRH